MIDKYLPKKCKAWHAMLYLYKEWNEIIFHYGIIHDSELIIN